MSYQSENELENQLIRKLMDKGYAYVDVKNEKEIEANFRKEINRLNIDNLKNKELTDKEFDRVLTEIQGKSVFESAKQLRDKFQIERENGEKVYLMLMDMDNIKNNVFQVANQITVNGTYESRYDVTILLNGLPVTQIELKKRGESIKEAFNQINKYQKQSYSKSRFFSFLQLLIVSNGVDTKYFSNNDEPYQYSQTFFWTDENNKRITNLNDFTDAFLACNKLFDMITTYIILNETSKSLMAMRPYQVYAVKSIVKMVEETRNGGFVWHSTGSGKTLTSFKASQIIARKPEIKKVIFLVDRRDLDTQTFEEFNKFEQGSVDNTSSTTHLVKQMEDESNTMIITTVQKLSKAISNPKYQSAMSKYNEERVVFIIDECHRSQFGKMNRDIKKFFKNSQFFGFTGTPRFKENKSQDDRTTADIFGKCLHSYMIKDAISDENVLGFSVEYFNSFVGKEDKADDEKVLGIDTEEVYEHPDRISFIANHIVQCHNTKTSTRKYTAIFATSSKDMLIKYYNEFKEIDHDLKIAAIYSFEANEDLEGKRKHSREVLDEIIADYNSEFGVNYDTTNFEGYQKDLSKKVKAGKVDILIVVDMFLTGFDSKPLNTLYVDKVLKYQDLLQAFSRTNRVYDKDKNWGNIVCYRNLKKNTDAAIRLFNGSDGVDDVLSKDYPFYLNQFKKQLKELKAISEKPEDIDTIQSENKKVKFVETFKSMAKQLLAMRTFVEFDFNEESLGIDEQTYEDFKSKYLLLYENVKNNKLNPHNKASILDNIDFCIELVQSDRINVDYIINLMRDINRENVENQKKDVEKIITELNRSDNLKLRSKSELISDFLHNQLPNLDKEKDVYEAYLSYESEAKEEEIERFIEENQLEEKDMKSYISEYEFTGRLDEEVIGKNIKKPLKEKRQIRQKIVSFIKDKLLKYQ